MRPRNLSRKAARALVALNAGAGCGEACQERDGCSDCLTDASLIRLIRSPALWAHTAD